jgi:pimeloyl-ACP methyl ester carboxylesterase
MWVFLATVLAILLILVGALLVLSPGTPAPVVDENGKTVPGSLSEKVFIDVNGVREGMFIQSKNPANPVLLYLHGGMPDFFLTQRYPTGLENDFTVVWWEQRGSGISYSADIPRETLTEDQMIADTLTVTNDLRRRFGKDKIYLMGHSGGTFIGIQAAVRAPDLFYAYIGQSQMVDQLESERLAYEYMLAQYKANGNAGMLRKLEAAPVTRAGGTPAAYLAVRDEAMHSLGIGTTRDMDSVVTGIFLPSWLSRDYTLAEKFNLWRGKANSGVSALWSAMTTTDLSAKTPELAIPMYFLHGVNDYTCSYPLAKAYFDKLKAPVKGFYTFENSAHSPMFEEPQKVQQILREDVLRGTNRLADGN